MKKKKGFTLIELLVVIGIIAVFSVLVTLIINPAEKFREARDVQRIADLRSVKDAINLYLIRGASPLTLNGAGCGSSGTTYPQWRASISNVGTAAAFFPEQPFSYSSNSNTVIESSVTLANARAVDGTGWVSVPFTNISSGNSPLVKLPLDPSNTALANSSLAGPIATNQFGPGLPPFDIPAAFFYAYQCKGFTYEIDANMESQKYSLNGNKDVESKDGGTNARIIIENPVFADFIYEVGNDPGLDL